ncbi:MAG: PAS domain-containing protein [Rhodobacter sp.]|nr:PAS domain-containing protein [Paracoccaceae bacterium]MCB1409267.1 PAS domain-containing protein [Paracoccaceae bacterium]MCC0080204.1 PAS domain-containing protein [Rhodobacter sp.]
MTPESPQTAQDFALMAFHGAPIALVMTERRVIRSCNLTFARLLGYRIDDLIGQSFRIFYGSDEEFEGIRDIGLTTLRETGQYTDERLVRHRAGHSLWCRFRASTLVPDAPLDRIVMSFARIHEGGPVSLSKRERQVLELMNRRLTSKEIAACLGLSARTVDDVRGRLIKRFGVRRAADILGLLGGRS